MQESLRVTAPSASAAAGRWNLARDHPEGRREAVLGRSYADARGNLWGRQVVRLDTPYTRPGLDDPWPTIVHLPPGDGTGARVPFERLQYWWTRDAAATRALINLAYRWHIEGKRMMPAPGGKWCAKVTPGGMTGACCRRCRVTAPAHAPPIRPPVPAPNGHSRPSLPLPLQRRGGALALPAGAYAPRPSFDRPPDPRTAAPRVNGRQYMGAWFRPAIDYPTELVDNLPGQGIGNPWWAGRRMATGS